MYCTDCYEILVPRDTWPANLRDGTFRLPFDVDIILDDRRSSSTGIQAATMVRTANGPAKDSLRIFDIEQDAIPKYEEVSQEEGTFLLFPGGSSKPLTSVLKTTGIKKLVVLDCKWSKPSIRLNPSIASLPRVHLDCATSQSYYWRYHNAGEGMVCTIEALYYAAWQAAEIQKWSLEEQKSLTSMMWIFGHQREAIRRRYALGGGARPLPPSLPFTEAGKEYQRKMRRNNAAKAHRTEKSPSDNV